MRGKSQLKRLLASLAFLVVAIGPARAVNPDEMLRDPTQEARARVLSEGLRCLVCQNQSIDDSNAPLAHDLRVLLRERISAGDSDKAAVDYIVARYGNFVLLKPPFQLDTLALWIGPLLVALAALVGTARFLRRNASTPIAAAPLSIDEEQRADMLLQEGQK
ncbi:MAG: cytochrome c-type biogenesis protein CcmH [Hyphomicrobiales bacterium]|nr:cytochrome c-type biogenesis protein CcmH [Hyphomicrobiales bacterium]